MKISFYMLSVFLVTFSVAETENKGNYPLIPEKGKEFSMITASPMGQQRRAERQKYFLERQSRDRNEFSPVILQEIEDLYQVANIQKFSDKAKENLEKLISDSRYEGANRIGCALLYLATMPNSENVEGNLKVAVEKYGDCWYGDGVNVGAYGAYLLGRFYKNNGNAEESEKYFKVVRDRYSDYVNHAGELLIDLIPKK